MRNWSLCIVALALGVLGCGEPSDDDDPGAGSASIGSGDAATTTTGAETGEGEELYGRCWLDAEGVAVFGNCPSDTKRCLIDQMEGAWGICIPPCETDPDCIDDELAGSCHALSPTLSVCLLLCGDEADCPATMLCQPTGSVRACVHDLS